MPRPDIDLKTIFGAFFSAAALVLLLPGTVVAQEGGEVTFSRDITPILQRSCQQCHNPNGGAPMSLVTYDEVRPYASRMARRTGIRDRMGAMPPWYVEKDIGIQHFKNDPSLSDTEIATVAAWARNGAPEGNPADLPEPLEFPDDIGWKLGEPDLIVSTEEMLVEGTAPDWWGDITPTPTGLTEDRYVKSVEIREVNDVPRAGSERETVGARWVFHHMVWSTRVLDNPRAGASTWPVHEVGRNPDIFDPRAGRILRAGSSIVSSSTHLHSNGRDTRARLEIGFRFHPEDYEPEYRQAIFPFGNGSDIDIRSGEKDQELHAYVVLPQHTKLVTFEPHLHAPGARMCLEAIWGFNIETLSCVGYDHNWVRGYAFEDDYQPILPKGTILHITGFMDNTDDNPNVPDARNWQGSGNRSVANMFIDLGERLFLSDEQFVEEMAQRRERLNLGVNDHVVGCPLCMVIPGS
ncbi:MAG: cytochrome c [Gemmatimonadetes bacterium]|jgi:mono/diheme cytochrome c family protein|nr:cytochrome c [Gemmatimonadota bacterium]